MLVFEHLATIPFPIIRGKPSYIFLSCIIVQKTAALLYSGWYCANRPSPWRIFVVPKARKHQRFDHAASTL